MAPFEHGCLWWLLLTATLGLPFELCAKPGELVFLNWADHFIDPVAIAELEAAFEVKVRQVYFETEDKRTNRRVPKQLNRLYRRVVGEPSNRPWGQP